MSWTKRDLVIQAFSEIGLSAGEYDLQPSELNDARIKLDAMVAAWNIAGLGYSASDKPNNSDLDDYSGLPDHANEAAYLGLAVKLAPSYGKAVPHDVRAGFIRSLATLRNKYFEMPKRTVRDGYPAGAGNRCITFTGDRNDCNKSFN